MCGVSLYHYKQFDRVWANTHRCGACLDTVVLFFTKVCRNPDGVQFPPPVKEDRGAKGVGTRSLGRARPCKWGAKNVCLGRKTVRTFVNAVAYAKDVKRGRFDPVHNLLFGTLQRPRRSRILWVVSRGVLWGIAVRQNAFIELQRVFVCDMPPGARLLEVSLLQTSTGTGTNLWLLGRVVPPATVPCKTND